MTKTLKENHCTTRLSRKVVRKALYNSSLPWSSHEHSIIDLCFPAELGPLGVDMFTPRKACIMPEVDSLPASSLKAALVSTEPPNGCSSGSISTVPYQKYNTSNLCHTTKEHSSCKPQLAKSDSHATLTGSRLQYRIYIQSQEDYEWLNQKCAQDPNLFQKGIAQMVIHWKKKSTADWGLPFKEIRLSSQKCYQVTPHGVYFSVADGDSPHDLGLTDSTHSWEFLKNDTMEVNLSDITFRIVKDPIGQFTQGNSSCTKGDYNAINTPTVQSLVSCLEFFADQKQKPQKISPNVKFDQPIDIHQCTVGVELQGAIQDILGEMVLLTESTLGSIYNRVLHVWGSDYAGRDFSVRQACDSAGIVEIYHPCPISLVDEKTVEKICTLADMIPWVWCYVCINIDSPTSNMQADNVSSIFVNGLLRIPNTIVIFSGSSPRHFDSTDCAYSALCRDHSVFIPFPTHTDRKNLVKQFVSTKSHIDVKRPDLRLVSDISSNTSTVFLSDKLNRWCSQSWDISRLTNSLYYISCDSPSHLYGYLKRMAKSKCDRVLTSKQYQKEIEAATTNSNSVAIDSHTVEYYVNQAKWISHVRDFRVITLRSILDISGGHLDHAAVAVQSIIDSAIASSLCIIIDLDSIIGYMPSITPVYNICGPIVHKREMLAQLCVELVEDLVASTPHATIGLLIHKRGQPV
ncbi:hypothetical protein BASA50_000037 [Batrachochytrium salamandrivorans]|uniref:Uncharacterized protein n=1 Tax=Batrachochytrium salamandrivorans TaxID=1357716 RepID=A0ABQ8EXQ8_9FUNG|nr:hypothetical protein BASA50_000037 [Batrachochytrium salamandrivorans]KAH9271596.1 hypothetical protein BASA83_006206 [Batrachochytrium salamandrivorans]